MAKKKHNRPKPKQKARRSGGRGPTPRRGEPDLMATVRAALIAGPEALLTLTSTLIAATESTPDPLFGDPRPEGPGLADLVDSFIGVPRPETTALLHGLHAMLPEELLLRASIGRELRERGAPEPAWLGELHGVTVRQVLETTEELRDGDNIVLAVSLPDGDELTAVVYVDHNMGTLVKDAFVLPIPVEQFVQVTRTSPDAESLDIHDLEPADAKARILQAIDEGEHTLPPFETDTWPACKPMIRWLLRQLPDGGREYEHLEWSEKDLKAIAKRFLASPPASRLAGDPDTRGLTDTLLWFGSGYSGTDPLRWSPVRYEIFLLSWLPRKVLDEASYLAKAPDVLRAFVQFAHAERGITPASTEATLATIHRFEPEYQRLIRSPRSRGPAALLGQPGPDGWGDDDWHEDDDPLFSDRWKREVAEINYARLVDEVGGEHVLDELVLDPLPNEELDWAGIPDDIVEVVRQTRVLLDRVIDAEFDDVELRTACRRLLARAASGDPKVFRHRAAKLEKGAAAIAWIVCRDNDVFDHHDGPYVKDLLAAFGEIGSATQRAKGLASAAGLPTDTFGSPIATPDLLTSKRRRQLVERRDQLRATLDES